MDIVKLAKWKKELIMKAWGKCKSNIGSIKSLSKIKSSKNNDINAATTTRSPSFEHYLKRSFTNRNPNDHNKTRRSRSSNNNKSKVAPDGCFSVYVGPEKQRFVVRTEHANHPLFRMLLEDAESEYGYNSNGPILLPCDVELFHKVLAEMESGDDDDDQDGFMMMRASPVCSLNILCSPLHDRVGSYKRLSPSRLIKMNQF